MPFDSPFAAIAPPPEDENREHWWNEGGPEDQAMRFRNLAKPIVGPEPEGQGRVMTPAEMQTQRKMLPMVIDEGGYPGWDVHRQSMMRTGKPSQMLDIQSLGDFLQRQQQPEQPRFRFATPGAFNPSRPFE
jgi:hypothetical protein